ncbi:MAG: LamG-like jellyroll fold domain-containing protein, partial [Bacteroidales bacterium]
WYNSTNNFADSTLIGSNTSTYDPPTGLTSTTKYRRYAKDNTCNTTFTKSTGSWVVTVNPVTTISSQSTITQTQYIDSAFSAISVTASGDGLSYQWYSNIIASNNGGTSLASNNGAQTKTYIPQAGILGVKYYYCIVNGTCGSDTSAISEAFITIIPPGNALAFDGVDDFINAGNNVSVQISTGTIEAWIKTSDAGSGYRAIVVKQWAYGLFLVDNVLRVFEWFDGSGGVEYSTGINLADNRWHHVAFSFNSGVTNGSFIYIDGELKNTFTYSSAAQLGIQNVGLAIGQGSITTTEQNFKGSIDEVRVWNTAQNQSELQSKMYSELVGTESGLVAYYNFNQGISDGDNTSITSLIDKTTNANNGTLTNFSKTGSTSNFVESFALVVPVPVAATSITGVDFTANWNAPVTGAFNNYILDVSTSSSFSSFVTGYNNLDCNTNLSQSVIGLSAGTTYYYRVKADKASVTGTGGYYRTPITAVTTCTNPTNGGTIASNQFIYSDATPAIFTSESLPTGHTGTLEYQWQSSTDSIDFVDLATGTYTATTYQVDTITVNTWYRRLARVSCMPDWNGCDTSNVVKITFYPFITPTDTIWVLADQDGTSANTRIPGNTYKYQRTEYLIKASEMSDAGFLNASLIQKILWKIGAAGATSQTGTLKIWLKNTLDNTYNLGLNWTTSDFVLVSNNASWTVPIDTGIYTIAFTNGSSFTYTGGGVYVAWEFSNSGSAGTTAIIAKCNFLGLLNGVYGNRSNTSLPTALSASNWRPATAFIGQLSSYSITFNADGGTGGEVQTVKHGITPVPPTVTKTGFTFNNWSPTIVAATINNTYTAQWTPNCSNPTNGGTIASNQTICSGATPAIFSSVLLPTGHIGTLEYQWQTSTDSINFADLATGTHTATTYQVDTITVTTWYRRLARVSCMPDWTGADTSNVVKITVLQEFITGTISSTGETICYNGNPALIGSTTAASGGNDTITYEWYKSTSNFTDSTLIGSNTATYDPLTGLTQTTSYRRYAKDGSCNTNFAVSAGEWTVTVRPQFTAGTITNTGQTICNAGTPTEIGSTTAASGGDGNISYKWQSSLNVDFTGTPTDINSNAATYTPTAGLTTTTWYRRLAKDATCNTTYTASSNTWKVTVHPSFTSGEIANAGETVYYDGNPSIIGSTTDASGGFGLISYQWQRSTTDAISGFADISGATSSTYNQDDTITI